MTRLGMAGSSLKVLVFAVVVSGSLILGVTGSFAATPATPYRTVATDTPTVVSPATADINAQFGTRLTASKDSTGDGIPDIVIASYSQDLPAAQVGGVADNNAGEVTLINGATQQVVWHVTPEPQAEPDPDQPYGIGFYTSAAGDVNADGLEDVIASQPFRDIGGNVDQGRVYVLDGKTGAVIRTLESPAPQANGQFGGRLGTAGDVTRDGVPDMLVGAPGHDLPAGCGNTTPLLAGCRKNEGQAYIFNGATGGLVRTLGLPAEDRAGCTSLGVGRCSFGGTVQSPGDINNDGWPDQTVAAYAYNPPGFNPPGGAEFVGRTYLFSGGGPTEGQVLAKIDPPGPPANDEFFGLEDPDRYAPGDLNADGTNDLYFSAFGANSTGGHGGAGRAWTFDGAATLAAGTGVVLYEPTDPLLGDNRAFGWANSKTDYNKDGRPDLFISNLATPNTSVSVFDGRDGSELKRFNTPAADVAADPMGAIGWSSRAPGDLNCDGEPDYVAGAPYQDVGGNTDQGRVYFFLSNVPGPGCPSPPSPAAPPATGGGSDTTAPGVSSYGLTNNPFAVGGSTPIFGSAAAKKPKKHKKGTTLRYTLSEAATVKIVISQSRSGRRKGKKCVAPTRKLRKAKKCTRISIKGTLTRTSHQGANSVAFSGRIGSKRLSPGKYQATLTATDAAKNTSKAKTISFKIVRR